MATPTRIELIKQYRDQGLSTLDAARAGNKAFQESKTPSTGGKNVSASLEPTFGYTSSATTNNGTTTVNGVSVSENGTALGGTDATNAIQNQSNATGTSFTDVGITPNTSTNKSSSTTPTPVVTSNTGTNNGTQGNKSTVAGGGATGTKVNPKSSQETNIARVGNDAAASYVDNVATDNKQLKDTVDATTTAYDEQNKLAGERSMNITLESSEEDLRQKKKANEDALIQQRLQDEERATAQANIAYVESQNQAAEYDAKIVADVALQQSNVAMAKLGLTLSTAGITSAQQIYQQGAYKIAELKTRNAYNVAKLKNDFAKMEFDHTNAVNTIIRESENKSYEIRTKLSKDIYDIKSSIIKNKLDKQTAINKAVDDYQKARDDNEKAILEKFNAQNKVLEDKIKGQYEALAVKEKYANTKISTAVTSGTWATMTPFARAKMEQEAGLPPGTIDKQINAQIGEGIFKELADVPITEGEYNSAMASARRLVDTGVPLNVAISRALLLNPKFRALVTKKAAGKGSGTGSSKLSTTPFVNKNTGELTTAIVKNGLPYDTNGNLLDLNSYIEAGNVSLGSLERSPATPQQIAAATAEGYKSGGIKGALAAGAAASKKTTLKVGKTPKAANEWVQ